MKRLFLLWICAGIIILATTSCEKECQCVTTTVYKEFPEYNASRKSVQYTKDKCGGLNKTVTLPDDAGTTTLICQ